MALDPLRGGSFFAVGNSRGSQGGSIAIPEIDFAD